MINSNSNHCKTGISFLEILVSLLLMSLLFTFVGPQFLTGQKNKVKKIFYSDFSMLVANAMHQAIITNQSHQIFWDLNKREISVLIPDEQSEAQNKHKKFKPSISHFKTTIHIPHGFTIVNFFINEKDEVKPESHLDFVLHYIMPDGTAQPVIINILDENSTGNNQFNITISPFYSQVSRNDAFQKP